MKIAVPRVALPAFAAFALSSCARPATAPPCPPAQPTSKVADPAPELEAAAPVAPSPEEHANALAQRVIILDGHVDLPYRLHNLTNGMELDLTQGGLGGNFDLPRARQGGLNAPFMSIYTPADLEGKAESTALAHRLIDIVESLEKRWPQHFAVVHSTAQLEQAVAAGKVALPLGMENGSPIAGSLDNLRDFHRRGIRYITLAHSRANHLSDSSYDENRPNAGLSDFGKTVVAEMNRLGIMIDVSHLSDAAFWQVLEHSKTPVIASHSSCRHFTPGFERNMSDDMIVALAKHGGVIQINFGSTFIDHEVREHSDEHRPKIKAELAAKGIESMFSAQAAPIIQAYNAANPGAYSTVDRVADHIDHVVRIAGIDHVGFGSDFDGVGDSLPNGLKDVAAYPNLIRVLIERGYDDAQIAKIAGGNVLRVWKAVESHSASPDAANP